MLLPLALIAAAIASPADDRAYEAAIAQVEAMVWNQSANQMVQNQGLSLVNVTWEDTGRTKGSVWGPNISDMTIGVRDTSGALHPMPVMRFDNFNDLTADLDPDRFWLRVGNARGQRLHAASLTEVLQSTRGFLHDPSSWKGWRSSLWAERDSHVLVSAQACFLPVPRAGEATFTPVIYNYQSTPDNPAVLTILATREGTSIQVVENESGYMSEVLTFNEDGQRAPFTAARLSDFMAQGGDGTYGSVSAAAQDSLNVVLLIQVPLKQKEVARWQGYLDDMVMEESAPMASGAAKSARSDVETAVIGHGATEGPFEEIGGLAIERDPSFPIRVTVQFYKATSNGVVTAADVAAVRRQIDRVYADGDYVGSLVTQGYTRRPTEWVPAVSQEPEPRWSDGTWGWKAF
ncbi:MAG: hypothetical protein ABIO70_24800 [Pseudomonadota bacterium]